MKSVIPDRLESGIRSLVRTCTDIEPSAAKLTLLHSKPRSTVVRVSLHPPWHGQHSLIAKQSAGEAAIERFSRELVTLRMFEELKLAPPVAPALVGCDAPNRLLILEDLGEQSLATVLLGTDCTAAREGLLDYARALGRIHAATIGRGAFLRGSNCDVNSISGDPDTNVEREATNFQMFCDAVGVALGPSFSEEVRTIRTILSRSGPFHALVHGDPCPDNERRSARGTVFLDFETCYFGHALIDAAYLCMGFPTCWCAAKAPDEILAQALLAYRQALSATSREAGDDATFSQHLQCACARWLLDSNTLVPRNQRGSSNYFMAALAADWPWGSSTARQRVLYRLQRFVYVARNLDNLPALTEAATRLYDVLASRWRAAESLYPAFCDDKTEQAS